MVWLKLKEKQTDHIHVVYDEEGVAYAMLIFSMYIMVLHTYC